MSTMKQRLEIASERATKRARIEDEVVELRRLLAAAEAENATLRMQNTVAQANISSLNDAFNKLLRDMSACKAIMDTINNVPIFK